MVVDGEFTLKSTKNDEKTANIKVMKSNYILQLSIKDNFLNFTSSKSFYSKTKPDKLLEKFVKNLSAPEGADTIRMKMVLTDKTNGTSKTEYIQVSNSDENLKDRLNQIKEDAMNNRVCVEPKENRFRVIIENSCSTQNDKKSISINSSDCMEQIIEGLQFLFKEIVKEQLDNSVVFTDDMKSATHRILVTKCNCDCKSRGFSIILNNYSSSEISELLVDKIRGKRK